MELLGIESRKLDFGCRLTFPVELSEAQVNRIMAHYVENGWKLTTVQGTVILRKDAGRIELSRQTAIIVAAETDLDKVTSSLQGLYRETLDRSLVFHLAASESAFSALYNRQRKKFRSAVTDCYYACYNALRSAVALLQSPSDADKLEHPGLRTPDADPKDCEWHMARRAKWVLALQALWEVIHRDGDVAPVTVAARAQLAELLRFAETIFPYTPRGENETIYHDAVAKSSKEAVLLERFLAERLYWLRIRADYKVDFEVTISRRTILEAMYGALTVVNAVSVLVKKQLAFGELVAEPDPFFQKEMVRGQVVDPAFSSGPIVRALLQSASVTWTVDPAIPERQLRGWIDPEKAPRRLSLQLARLLEELGTEDGDGPSKDDLLGVGVLNLESDGSFSIELKEPSIDEEQVMIVFVQNFLGAIRNVLPQSVVHMQLNAGLYRRLRMTLRRETTLRDYLPASSDVVQPLPKQVV